MITKQVLLNQVNEILKEAGFKTFTYRGCFDIVARRNRIVFIKVLVNVDSFQEAQANNLKALSKNLESGAAVVGLRTRRIKLRVDVVYERFGLPTLHPTTLRNIFLEKEKPEIFQTRGGQFVDIDSNKLKKYRLEHELTQEELAEMLGVTKKSVYEHERKDMRAVYSVALEMEKIFKKKIAKPIDILEFEKEDIDIPARTKFEKSIGTRLENIGFMTKFVHQAPFNIMARERVLVLSSAEEDVKRIKHKLPALSAFSEVCEKPTMIITKEKQKIGEIPAATKDELREIKNPKELIKMIKKW